MSVDRGAMSACIQAVSVDSEPMRAGIETLSTRRKALYGDLSQGASTRIRCPLPPGGTALEADRQVRRAPHAAQNEALGVRKGLPQDAQSSPYRDSLWCMIALWCIPGQPVSSS